MKKDFYVTRHKTRDDIWTKASHITFLQAKPVSRRLQDQEYRIWHQIMSEVTNKIEDKLISDLEHLMKAKGSGQNENNSSN